MRPVTAAFKAAVGSSHQMNFRARILSTVGQNGVNPTGTVIPIEGGPGCTFDTTAQVLATVDLTTSQNWPVNAADLLTPYGNELFVERGLVYNGGSTEWVSLGYYRINQSQQNNAPFGAVDLSGTDRMQGIIDARLPAPWTFTAGTTVASIITTLITDAYSWATFAIDANLSSATIQVDQVTTDDRYGFINDLVTSYGMIWYWDYRGVLVVKPLPSLTKPVASIGVGRNGVMVTLSRTLSRDGVYAGCVASSNQVVGGSTPSALVVDNNPASPTYWYGKFGKIPRFYSSSFLTTTAQCTSAATSIMQKSTGLPYEVDFGFVSNPSLEAYDPVSIVYTDGRTETHTLKKMVIGPKATDPMTAQTRQLVNGMFNVIASQ